MRARGKTGFISGKELKRLRKAAKLRKGGPQFVPIEKPMAKKNMHPDANTKRYTFFYQLPEWKHARYEALRASEGKCQCCGASSKTGATLHVDHIKPRSTYPQLELDPDNLQVLCEDCNIGKSNLYVDSWK